MMMQLRSTTVISIYCQETSFQANAGQGGSTVAGLPSKKTTLQANAGYEGCEDGPNFRTR